jgi:hypothetical protein
VLFVCGKSPSYVVSLTRNLFLDGIAQVAQSRVRIEENIEATLRAIKDRLPGLNMYRHIYNEDHELDQLVQSHIVDTYTSFMDYCIEALEFYTQGGCHRFLQTLTNQNSLSIKAEQVQQAVVKVRLVCEETLNKNVNTIKQKLEEVQVSNDKLQAQIKGMALGSKLSTVRSLVLTKSLYRTTRIQRSYDDASDRCPS